MTALCLWSNFYLGEEIVFSANGFPRLTFLGLSFDYAIKLLWVDKSAMPSLKHLSIQSKEENVAIFQQYIAEISRVEGYRHNFSCRNIGQTIFRDKSREIGDISAILARNRRFFLDISLGQRGSTSYSESQMCYSIPATVHLPKQIASEGI